MLEFIPLWYLFGVAVASGWFFRHWLAMFEIDQNDRPFLNFIICYLFSLFWPLGMFVTFVVRLGQMNR